MKVEVISLTDKVIEDREYRDRLVIKIDGKNEFHVSDGEPEDARLGRDFSDCWKIPELMTMAHEAGAKGEAIEIVITKVDEI